MIELSIRTAGLDQIALDLAATDDQAQKALRSTLGKMAAWIRGKSMRELPGATNIPARIVRRRLKSFRVSRLAGGGEVVVWYGLDPVGVIYLKPKRTGTGVSAHGGRNLPGAFIARGRNGNPQVFRRRGKKRLPIDKETAEIEGAAGAYIEGHLIDSAEFDARFFTVFERELKWRMQTQR